MPDPQSAKWLAIARTAISLLEQSVEPKMYNTPHRQRDYEIRVKAFLADVHKMKEFKP